MTRRISIDEKAEIRPDVSGNIKPAIVVLNGGNDDLSLLVMIVVAGNAYE